MRPALIMTLLLAACAPHQAQQRPPGADDLHGRMLTLDAHLDAPMHFARQGWSFGDRHGPETDLIQLDIPRMADGHLDGGFFVIYTPQGPLTQEGYAAARDSALRRSDEILNMIAQFPERIALAGSADQAERIASQGRLVAFKSIENSYPIGEDLSMLAELHRRGVRLAGPVHSSNNQFADSATDTPRWNGLSPLGRQWMAEMNRLGMVIDASHASDAVFDQMLALSRSPLLLSHSGSRTIFDHPRNLDDDRIRALARAGGAICVTSVYLSSMNLSAERAELFDRLGRIGELSPAEQAELTRLWRALDRREAMWDADFEDFMRALLHVIGVAGVDHVCIGMDWDGGGGVAGIEDITALPRLTARLQAAGFSEADIEKMWSGNILRILRAAERVR